MSQWGESVTVDFGDLQVICHCLSEFKCWWYRVAANEYFGRGTSIDSHVWV